MSLDPSDSPKIPRLQLPQGLETRDPQPGWSVNLLRSGDLKYEKFDPAEKLTFFAQDNWSIVHVAGDFSVYSVCDGHGINGALEQILMKLDQLSDSMQ